MGNSFMPTINGSVRPIIVLTAHAPRLTQRGCLHMLWFCSLAVFTRPGCANNSTSSCYIEPELGVVMWSFRVFLAVFPCHELCGPFTRMTSLTVPPFFLN